MEVPVVSTSVSGIPELIDDGKNGLLVPPRDVTALTEELARVLCDASLRKLLGQNARRTVTQRFELQRNARRLKILFAHALSSSPQITRDDLASDEPDVALMGARVQS